MELQHIVQPGKYCQEGPFTTHCLELLNKSEFRATNRLCVGKEYGEGFYEINGDSIHFHFNNPPPYESLYKLTKIKDYADSIILNLSFYEFKSQNSIYDVLVERRIRGGFEYEEILNNMPTRSLDELEYIIITKEGYVPLRIFIEESGQYDLDVYMIKGDFDSFITDDYSFQILKLDYDSIVFSFTFSTDYLEFFPKYENLESIERYIRMNE